MNIIAHTTYSMLIKCNLVRRINVELTIKIDNEEFAKAITQDLENLPGDVLRQITIEAAKQYLAKDDTIKKLFIQETYGYNSSTNPTQFFREVLSTIDWNPVFSGFAEKARQYMSEKYPEIMAQAIATLIERSMFSGMAFQEAIVQGIALNREKVKEFLLG